MTAVKQVAAEMMNQLKRLEMLHTESRRLEAQLEELAGSEALLRDKVKYLRGHQPVRAAQFQMELVKVVEDQGVVQSQIDVRSDLIRRMGEQMGLLERNYDRAISAAITGGN